MKYSRCILLMLALIISISMRGQYNPTNPSEPGVSNTLTLKVTPEKAGYFNINEVTTQIPGTDVRIRAYNNSNFTFVAWEEDGNVISTTAQFDYTMPRRNVTLTAHYDYNPSNPDEPTTPNIPVFHKLYITANPVAGGSFNINSGNSYEVGSSISLRAYTNSNFNFVNWTENGEVISTSSSFNYIVKDADSHLLANYSYNPTSPDEPSEARLMHSLNLQANPSAGGYFNVNSGNRYEEGATVSLRAYNNQYYAFESWTIGDSIISTNYQISYIMPTHDITLRANYTYNYSPDDPSEPGQADAHIAIYGMTEDAIRGQNITYPILLENTNKEVLGCIVDVKFPEGFIVSSDGISLSSRASGHTLEVVNLGDNNYRLFVRGTEAISGDNGHLLEIPVSIPDTAVMGQTYPVVLSHGVLLEKDESQTSISVRNGGILIEKVSEEGLYSRFSFDKYQNRVKFKNNSSDKAVRYEWNFGDGETSTEKSPIHVYSQSGAFIVTLTAYGEVDKDIAEMNVIINESSSWTAQGSYTLTSDENSVRSFSSMNDLVTLLSRSTINGNLHIMIESGQSFSYELSTENVQQLSNLQNSLHSTGYTMTFEKQGSGRNPEIKLGSDLSAYDAKTLNVLVKLGILQRFNDVELKIWGIYFDVNHLRDELSQTVCSGIKTEMKDFSLLSRDLTFKWTLQNPPTGFTGFETSGERQLPTMTIINEQDGTYDFTYHVSCMHDNLEFYSFDYHIIVNPALVGLFGNLSPIDEAVLDNTEVTLTWNKIANATFDVYLWDAKNNIPSTPVAENIRELRYTSSRFCANGNAYRWLVKAHNDCQELVSDTMSFSIENLPDLHIYSLDCSEAIGDGKVTIKWTVKNDGKGGTGNIRWNDYIWLVPDVFTGTTGTGSTLLKTVENIKALEPGESYEASSEVSLPKHAYGNYFLIVSSDMYNVSDIQWSAIGGSIITPYNPAQDGSSYKHLYATTSSEYNKVYEQDETSTLSDNFFYKKIEIAVPDLADLQVTDITASVIPTADPILAAEGPSKAISTKAGEIAIGPTEKEWMTWEEAYVPNPLSAVGLRHSNGFYSGKKIAIKVTVSNKGGVETGKPFRTVLYMSSSADRETAPLTAISSETCEPSILSDGSAVITFAFYMPYEWSGNTFFHAYADVDDNIYELANTVNNWGTSDKYEFLQIPGADFKPASLNVPKTISVNAPFNLSYEIKNVGAGVPFQNKWKDKIYLSKKNTGLDESATCIATIGRGGYFALTTQTTPSRSAVIIRPEEYHYEGDNYKVSQDITVSNLESGKYYLYLKVDADDDVLEIGGEDDNVLCSGEVNCIAPDLEAEWVGLSADTVKTEATLAITWKIKNTGSGAIQNATLKDAFYASVNQDGANSIKVAEVSNTVTIAAGQEKTLRANITIPKNSNLNGLRYIFMKTNIDNSVKEVLESNNQTLIKKMVFEYLATPEAPIVKGTNIVLSDLTIPTKVVPGEEFNLSIIVKNQGENTVDKEIVYEVFIGNSSNFDINSAVACQTTVKQGTVQGLKTGAATNISLNVTLPANTEGGNRYLFVYADRKNVLGEKNTGDNITHTTAKIEGNQPDLVIRNVACPENIMTSTDTEISMDYVNDGSWSAKACHVGVYLSQDATYSRNDELLASISVPAVESGTTLALKTKVSIEDKKNGKWYILLRADCNNVVAEKDETNNDVAIPVQVTLSPVPDLSPTQLGTDEILTVGRPMKIVYTIANSGENATRQDKWSDTYYLSTSATLNPDTDIKLGSKTHVGYLEPGKSYNSEVQFTIPQGTVGNYMLYVVTDASNAVYESNENNNSKCIPVYVNSQSDHPADLVISNVSAPSHLKAGQNTAIEYTISNTGEFTANGELNDAIYLSKDNKWDANDIMVGIVKGEVTIHPGASVTRSATGRIVNVTEGDYYVIVRTNSTRTLAEQDMENNTAVQKSPSTVKFDEITVDGSAVITTSGLYKINVTSVSDGKTLGFYLDHNEEAQAGLYVSYEKVPSTAIYDNASCNLETTQQEVLMSNVQQGNYYILAQDNRAVVNAENNRFYLDGMPSEQSTILNLSAKKINFGATSFSINQGGTGGWLSTEVKGALFDSIMDFRLQMDKKVIPAEAVTFKGQTASRVTFNLNDADPGSYNVVSELPDGTLATLPDGFKVIPGASVGLGIKMDVPSVVRAGSYAPISIAYANGGTTDIEIYELLLVIDEGYLGEDIKDLDNHQSALHIKPDFGSDTRGYISIPPGTQNVLNLYMYQIASSSTITIYIVK
ncbi:CARDB domain-containing protein [Bacteroides sp.]